VTRSRDSISVDACVLGQSGADHPHVAAPIARRCVGLKTTGIVRTSMFGRFGRHVFGGDDQEFTGW
jgi:hypothetical protein